VKLYGKELDDELARRRQARDERIGNRISFRDAAKAKGIKPSEFLALEYGYDVCPHEEWKDSVGGFPVPLLIFKVCKKCGKVDENTAEKVNDTNMERVYNVYREIYPDKPEDAFAPEQAHTCEHGMVGDGSCSICSALEYKEENKGFKKK